MIAMIGYEPYSVIIINDRHDHGQQQLVLLHDDDDEFMPEAVAISPGQDTVAVMLRSGSLALNCMQLSFMTIDRHPAAAKQGRRDAAVVLTAFF
jgi:hypothetical protein